GREVLRMRQLHACHAIAQHPEHRLKRGLVEALARVGASQLLVEDGNGQLLDARAHLTDIEAFGRRDFEMPAGSLQPLPGGLEIVEAQSDGNLATDPYPPHAERIEANDLPVR